MTAPRTGFPPPPPTLELAPVKFGKVKSAGGQRIVLYGPGGIGKTTLATQAAGPVAFFDLDESLGILKVENVQPVEGINTWSDIRNALHAPGWDGIKTIVIDTLTRAEELCTAHTLETVPHEKGHRVKRMEDYGFSKGYAHVYDEFLKILGDIDTHTRAGRNVILICHDCTSNVPNPAGDDWLRYEPRLQNPNSGKSSIRLRVREWADHVLFMGYDVAVGKDGKGKGVGSRTIYPAELPHCMAKSRTCRFPIPVIENKPMFNIIINGQQVNI